MNRFQCPACGAKGYRGGRCRECGYKPFTEEIAHRNHYHQGEPLVRTTRPKARRPDQGCDSFEGKAHIPQSVQPLLVAGIGVGVVLLDLAPILGLTLIVGSVIIRTVLKGKK